MKIKHTYKNLKREQKEAKREKFIHSPDIQNCITILTVWCLTSLISKYAF